MPSRTPLAFSPLLLVLLLATCSHTPPEPPAGMARLVVRCCELAGGTAEQRPNRTLDAAAVWIDGAERGTCANWRRDGAILSTGRHVIQVKVPLDGPLEEDECCVDAGAYVTLHAGDIQVQQVGLKRLRASD
jgi:hypothetical protein